MSNLALSGGKAELAGMDEMPSWPQAREGDNETLLEILRSGNWGSTSGEVVHQFEQEFTKYQDAMYGTALVNGTLAIVAALRASGVGMGDEVIVPPYTFIATAAAPLFVGAVPVFADIDLETHLLDPAAVEAAITPRTRAVIPVHLGGRAADMDSFQRIAAKRQVAIIEDCAQAIGTRYKETAVGSLGDVGTFSFQSSKNMSAGEGGFVTTNDPSKADLLYSLVNVGRVRDGGWYEHQNVGLNLRMTEFQGSILRSQLRHHPADQSLRSRNAEILDAEFRGAEGLHISRPDPNLTTHGHHLYLMRVPELGRAGLRDAAVKALAAEGVQAAAGYVPLHRNKAIQSESQSVARHFEREWPERNCPNADIVSSDTIWLPQRMLLGTEDQTLAIARAVRKVVKAEAELRQLALSG